ncbi:MAG: flagellar hook-associated protein FlgK [Oleiphilus sp.]|nr:MAG: flagellar hook-associated protein FlgK [Oleiphilus sp.]
MADLIGIGLSGLRSHQTALSVTGNNVANTNTQGYTRQQAIFESSPSTFTGFGYVGQGVNIESITRIAQDFVIEQVRGDTTLLNGRKATLAQAEAIDNLLASTTTGLTPALSSFFQAFQGAADDPASIPQRQLLLTQAEGLVSRFRALDQSLNSQKELIDQELEAAVAEINSLAQGLVEINQAIASASTGGGVGNMPNDLLDERDETLRKLSEFVSVTSIESGLPGQVNVFIGNGQPLVVGNAATPLTTPESPRDSSKLDVALNINGTEQVISEGLSGGKLGALLDFRDNELEQAINGLGRVALVLADTVNAQHQLGMDLEDNLGGLFFSDVNDAAFASARVIPNGGNAPPLDQNLSVNIIDTMALTTDSYEVRFEGPSDDDFNIVRMSDGEVLTRNSLPGVFPATAEIDGFEIVFESGTYKVGDLFTVMPTQRGARDIGMVVDRVEELAFASPVRAEADIGNAGEAQISLGTMLDVDSPITNQALPIFANPGTLSPPLGIQFIRDNYYEVVDMSDPANPAPLVPPMNNRVYSQGLNNAIFTSDPGETLVTSTGPDTQVVPAAGPSAGPLLNGYGAQQLTFLTRDDVSGVVTQQTYNIAANSSAQSIAAGVSAQSGVSANAYTQVRLSNFTDNGDATPLGVEINGESLVPVPPATFSADTLADLINDNPQLASADIYAVSDGVNVNIRAFSGADIDVVVTGSGDSVDVSKLDPYSAGTPVLATQTLISGQGIAVGGMVDITMADGVSMTADVASVFQQAPPALSTYLGFTFDIQGETVAGDRFTVDYNEGGVSDNRNALAIANLETKSLISGGIESYGESYSKIVEQIGTTTNRARLDEEAAEALLDQSQGNRDAISGVNLDEEAGRLIQFQAAYNASAQVVSVARQLFDTLIGAFN